MLLLKRLSSEAEMIPIYEHRFLEWGGQLDRKGFQEREKLLARTAWARKGLENWGLYDHKELLASCEIWPIQVRSQTDLQGAAIASVLVEKKHRGNGYASKLISKIKSQLEISKSFLCLFSEVGTPLYERLRFTEQKTAKIVFETGNQSELPLNSSAHSVAILNRTEALERWRIWQARRDIARILPFEEQLDWYWTRSDFYAEKLNHDFPSARGLESNDSLIILGHDFKNRILKVLHVHRGERTSHSEWLNLWSLALSIGKLHSFASLDCWIPSRLHDDLIEMSTEFNGSIKPEINDIPMVFSKDVTLNLSLAEIEMQCWV